MTKRNTLDDCFRTMGCLRARVYFPCKCVFGSLCTTRHKHTHTRTHTHTHIPTSLTHTQTSTHTHTHTHTFQHPLHTHKRVHTHTHTSYFQSEVRDAASSTDHNSKGQRNLGGGRNMRKDHSVFWGADGCWSAGAQVGDFLLPPGPNQQCASCT